MDGNIVCEKNREEWSGIVHWHCRAVTARRSALVAMVRAVDGSLVVSS